MIRATTVLLVTALILVACGDGSAPAGSQPPGGGSGALVVTSDNSKPASRAAYGATQQSVETGGLVGSSGGVVYSPGGLNKPATSQALSKLLTRALQKVPFGPDVFPCAIAGTTTISGDVQSLFGFAVGDQINVETADCDDGFGEVINGRIEFTVSAFNGDLQSGLYRLEMSLLLIDFEVATAIDTVLSNGDATVTVDLTGSPIALLSISGNSLTTQTSTQTDSISNFLTTETVDTSVIPEPYTLASSGTIDSTDLSGTISYSTPVTFQGSGADYPFAGELLIAGAAGASIRLIALDNVNVRIETDIDGDGSPDATEDTTWSDIAGQL